MKPEYEKYFRNNLPHIWCAGCGHGIVMSAWARAVYQLGLDKDQCVAISGIGCSSRITGYIDMHTMNTTHGRALTFATGVKMARPDLNVFVFSGDGDGTAIGGNHFIHACRRNIDMTVVLMNNNIYGMTGGQFSPMTPFGKKATTCPYGSIDRSFDMAELAKGAGATFVARSDIFHAKHLTDMIVAGFNHKGFSILEAVSSCPISYGRRNGTPDPRDMMDNIKDMCVMKAAYNKLSDEEKANKIPIGILQQIDDAPEYTSEYEKLVERVQGGAK